MQHVVVARLKVLMAYAIFFFLYLLYLKEDRRYLYFQDAQSKQEEAERLSEHQDEKVN